MQGEKEVSGALGSHVAVARGTYRERVLLCGAAAAAVRTARPAGGRVRVAAGVRESTQAVRGSASTAPPSQSAGHASVLENGLLVTPSRRKTHATPVPPSAPHGRGCF